MLDALQFSAGGKIACQRIADRRFEIRNTFALSTDAAASFPPIDYNNSDDKSQ